MNWHILTRTKTHTKLTTAAHFAPQDSSAHTSEKRARLGARTPFKYFMTLFAMASLVQPSALMSATPSPVTPTMNAQIASNQAAQLFAMGNQARAALGLTPLEWDPALAAAA